MSGGETVGGKAGPGQARQGGRRHDRREREIEKEDGKERRSGDRTQGSVLQNLAANAQHRLDNDRQHCGLYAEEKRLDDRQIMKDCVEKAQRPG